MRFFRWLASGVVAFGIGCGSDASEGALPLDLSNLVGYWSGYETNLLAQGSARVPRVLKLDAEYAGTKWYAEAVGYESNFSKGSASLTDGLLSLHDFEGHPPRRLKLLQISENSLEIEGSGGAVWTMERQAGCAIPFTLVGEIAGLRPVFLSDGTLVLSAVSGAFLQVVPKGHCVPTASNATPGKAMAAAPNGGLWVLDVELTPTNEARIVWSRVTDLLAEFPVIETEIVAESDVLNTNENYGISDDGLGNPVVSVSRGTTPLMAWKRVDGVWAEFEMPDPENDTYYAWRAGDLKAFSVPQDPVQGRLQIPIITKDDVVWGVFTETMNGYSGRINLVRVDGPSWTSWPVGFGQPMGLRVRDDGVVDIAVRESRDLANLGVIEATPDGDDWLSRYRRIKDPDIVNLANSGEFAFGPDGTMFFGESMRVPKAERGEREAIIKVFMKLAPGVTKIEVPVLGITCEEDCEFMMPDNEGVEARISASAPAALVEAAPGLASIEVLSDDRSMMMVLGMPLREPHEVQLEATTALPVP